MNAALGSTWWSDWTGNLARQGELVTLVVAGAALVWLLLLLFHGREEVPEEGRGVGPVVPSGAVGMIAGETRAETRAERAPVPVAAAAGAAGAEPADAARGGYLSPTDIIALTALRRRIQDGRVTEDPVDARHLAFARWLVEQGKLMR
jgi:hypothetical protein